MTPQFSEKLLPEQASLLVYSIMNDAQRKQHDAEKELNFAIAVDGGRFRVNAYREQNKTAMVLRKINTKVPTLKI